jgi:hypothetical protein
MISQELSMNINVTQMSQESTEAVRVCSEIVSSSEKRRALWRLKINGAKVCHHQYVSKRRFDRWSPRFVVTSVHKGPALPLRRFA